MPYQRPHVINHLIVFPKSGSSGIWTPNSGGDKLRIVEHSDLKMPIQLSRDFDEFNHWTAEALSDSSSDELNQQFLEKGTRLSKDLALFMGEFCQVEFFGRRVLPDLDIEPLSREFIFGRRYASQRNRHNFSSPIFRTYLSALIWNEMVSEDRKRIFPGMFDLGNGQTVPVDLCTETPLAKELSIDPHTRPFKSVHEGIKRLLGRDVIWYANQNPSTTFKVVKLLYQILRYRHNRLFHFLKLPDNKRYTLELRYDTPFVDGDVSTEEAVWLLADLKTYLSLELAEQVYIEIQTLFDDIPLLLERFRLGTEQVLVEAYGNDYANASTAYVALVEEIADFAPMDTQKENGLDEDLCAYVQSLEFFHFAVGAPDLFHKAVPSDVKITPVTEELTVFTSGVYQNIFCADHLHIPCLSIDEIPFFVRKNWNQMVAIFNKAMSNPVNWTASDDAIADVQSVIHNFFWFQHQKPSTEVDTQSKRVSPWICVAALCCVWHMRENPMSHKTYSRLMPQGEGIKVLEPTRSLLNALKQSKSTLVAVDSMTLEHRLIWRHRLEWFCDSLIGQSELLVPKFRYRVALVEKLIEIIRKNRDSSKLERSVNEFYDFVKKSAFKISATAPD